MGSIQSSRSEATYKHAPLDRARQHLDDGVPSEMYFLESLEVRRWMYFGHEVRWILIARHTQQPTEIAIAKFLNPITAHVDVLHLARSPFGTAEAKRSSRTVSSGRTAGTSIPRSRAT